MTDAVSDVVPVIRNRADLERLAAANPDRPVLLYVTGRHPADAEHPQGYNCSACESFDRANADTFRNHRDGVIFAQIPVELTMDAFRGFAGEFNLQIGGDENNPTIGANGKTRSIGTPMLLNMQRGANGQLTLNDFITPGEPADFDRALTALETSARGTTPQRAAAAPTAAPEGVAIVDGVAELAYNDGDQRISVRINRGEGSSSIRVTTRNAAGSETVKDTVFMPDGSVSANNSEGFEAPRTYERFQGQLDGWVNNGRFTETEARAAVALVNGAPAAIQTELNAATSRSVAAAPVAAAPVAASAPAAAPVAAPAPASTTASPVRFAEANPAMDALVNRNNAKISAASHATTANYEARAIEKFLRDSRPAGAAAETRAGFADDGILTEVEATAALNRQQALRWSAQPDTRLAELDRALNQAPGTAQTLQASGTTTDTQVGARSTADSSLSPTATPARPSSALDSARGGSPA